MTRVNLVDPSILSDQHLIAEYREISRLPNSLQRSLRAKTKLCIPSEYTFGTGHVKFFYNKLGFIKNRHDLLKLEGIKRGFNLNTITISIDGIDSQYCLDYIPDCRSIEKSKERILEKLNMKPSWYKYCGQPIGKTFLEKYL